MGHARRCSKNCRAGSGTPVIHDHPGALWRPHHSRHHRPGDRRDKGPSVNLQRLNHILIPRTKTDRDRFRRSHVGRIILRLFFFVFLLTDEGRGAILLWLTAVLISLNVGRTQFYFLSSALTGLLMLSLFAARWFRLKDTHIEAAAPRRTIVDQPLTFTITLCNSGQQTFHNVRLRLPFLPWDGQWIMQPDALKTFEAGELVHLRAKARFVARGASPPRPVFSQSARSPRTGQRTIGDQQGGALSRCSPYFQCGGFSSGDCENATNPAAWPWHL